MLLFLFGTLLSGSVSNGGGVLITVLTSNLSATGLTVTVRSTENFLDTDYITIGSEKILYSSKDATHFYVSTGGRGQDGTTDAAHLINEKVYSPEATILNEALNVNPAAVKSNTGAFAVIQIPFTFLTHTLPNLVTMNFSFFQGDAAIIGYIFMICAAGFVLSLALSMLWVAAGVVKLL